MSLSLIFLTSCAVLASTLFFLLRLVRFRTLLRFHWLVDLIFHIVAAAAFYGTLGGMLVATTATLMLSALLSAGRGTLRLRKRMGTLALAR